MDRKIFRKSFKKKDFGGWPCPTCGKGTLIGDPQKFTSETTVESYNDYEKHGEPELIDIGFSGLLTCSDSRCKEKVICIGSGNPSYNVYFDETGPSEPDYINSFSPLFFYPHLKIFQIPEEMPPKLNKYIFYSFQLFFCNPGSSLNNLRIALEEILDYLGVKKFVTRSNGRFRLNLHERVNLLDKKYTEIKDWCLAIKWQGNAGSHSHDNITKDDVLDAYDIFEAILENLFGEKAKKANLLAKQINKRKGIKKT